MITNSKPELCERCNGSRNKPRLLLENGVPPHGKWHDKGAGCTMQPPCQPCPEPFHSQGKVTPSDKHKRVAERQFQKLEDMLCQPMQNLSPEVLAALADILREEYPE